MLYFDNNATTPIGGNALNTFSQSLELDWFNPSSPYRSAAKVRAKLELLREELASIFSLNHDQLIFTSGATESNNAVFAHCSTIQGGESRCLISPFEHPSVSDSAKKWFKDRIIYLPHDGDGKVLLNEVQSVLKKEKITLVSLMAANNESGVIQPWEELSEICSSNGIFFHTDATQWIGKIGVSTFSNCTSFCGSGHKFNGPKGIGFLASKIPVNLICGGTQEFGLRGGTESFPAIASMITAFKDTETKIDNIEERSVWRDNFENQILKKIPYSKVLGVSNQRLWNTSLLVLPKFNNLRWVSKLDKLGFQVSTGSACTTGGIVDKNSMLETYSLDINELKRVVRVSSYLSHTDEDWSKLQSAFEEAFGLLCDESSDLSVLSL